MSLPAATRTSVVLAIIALAVAPGLLVGQSSSTSKPGQSAPPPVPPKSSPAKPAGTSASPSSVTALTDTGWPREYVSGSTTFTVYQPQVDDWNGVKLKGRAAVGVDITSKAPVYGIVYFSTETDVDKQTRLALLENFIITKASFPNHSDKARQWTSMLEARIARQRTISLDRLEASVANSTALKKAAAQPVKNEAPVIIFSTTPALLVPVDGDAIYHSVPNTRLDRVINTRPLILRDETGRHFVKIFDGWMASDTLMGTYTVTTNLPPDADAALKFVIDGKIADLLVGGDPEEPSSIPSLKKPPVPTVHVQTRPAEMIVTDGPPKYVPIDGTKLLYAENTTGNIFMDTSDQRAFVLVSGRWFAGPSNFEGPWTFIEPDRLPADFKAIPDTSAKENVKASIAGTPQAEEALVANSVPQTAKVKRSTATFTPSYDGAPKIEKIEGTELSRVVNASLPVIKVDDTEYYGVENGVWFVASSLNGPWLVATNIPAAIYSIPASSPVHNVTYVQVYDSTPEYVVVGYTPGYYGAYPYGGCVVYGTGYYYTPWVGSVWYGPPVTYGYGVAIAYTPWTGWHVAFGMGWAWGAATVSVGWGWGPYPYWGPYGYGWGGYYPYAYRPGYGAAWGPRGAGVWGPGYWAGTTGNVYSRWGANTAVTRTSGGYNAWTGNGWARQTGASYNSRTGTLSAGQRATVGNAYTGNYASASRGAASNAQTGVSARGGSVTAGNAYTGRETTAGRATVTGPGGNSGTIGGVQGNNGGVVRGPNNTYAGYDGNVYRTNGAGGWEKNAGGGWETTQLSGANGNLNREAGARSAGTERSGNYSSGGYRSAGSSSSRPATTSRPTTTSRPSGGASRPSGGGRRR